MIIGAHIVIYSKDAQADRTFIGDVLGFSSVNVGRGWLIFALPPAEVAVHPAGESGRHELYLMCDDLKEQMAALKTKGVACSQVDEASWGSVTRIQLPGGEIGLYQPRHASPVVDTAQ